ncbi:HAD family hydrolase [Halospeciosus flavus]|uniref:HAD family hydrolase n=1 Tax=Halospeciosus flavus TaxID=3032283 RepID=A0ABD5Z0X4_9EURY|nr:HAD family hydrolase [Halospeciosus flavus]
MTYDTVVFDNDGVLVRRTSYNVLEAAAADTFKQFDIDPEPDHVEEMAVGVTPEKVQSIADQYGLDRDEFWSVRDRVGAEAQYEEIRQGRKELYDDLDTLHDLDVRMGIVSSNQQATVDYVLDHYDVDHLFETAYGREPTVESLRRRKPNSHYIDQALADLDAENALFVGDNESDIRAAENAGIDSAFIRRPHRRDWDLNVWPTWDIDRLDDLHDIVQ